MGIFIYLHMFSILVSLYKECTCRTMSAVRVILTCLRKNAIQLRYVDKHHELFRAVAVAISEVRIHLIRWIYFTN